jgi:hypothetical protein
VEIKEGIEDGDSREQDKDKKDFEDALLSPPVLREEEIRDIESIGDASNLGFRFYQENETFI